MDDIQTSLGQANVLIVDESFSNVNTLTRMLKQKEYSVKIALNGESALQSARENPTDIILINVNLPDMNGCQVCEILKVDENLKKIPIIFISTCNGTIDKDKVFTSGGADFITLPFNCKEVISKIETHLKQGFMQLELKKLDDKLTDKTRQLEEITAELKEFNVVLEEEITQRTKTEEALRESEKKFRYSIKKAPVPIMLFTEDGEIIKINRNWTEITGYTIKDIPTISKWEEASYVITKNIENTRVSRFTNFNKRQNEGETPIRTKTGEIQIWDFYSAFIGKMQDGRNMFMRIAIDLTERKYIEKLQKKIEEEKRTLEEVKKYDRIKIEFFANISHELRTPINVIFSALQIHEIKLNDGSFKSSSKDIYKYTKIMKQNCYRLLRLVNNLIDITKIDAGYFLINKINYNIINLIEDITLSVADYVENKGLSIIFDTDVEEKIIACDPEKIERIILNLLSNAVKFNYSGGKIMVSIVDGIENVCVRVKDTGRGIPPDKLTTIFERFVQVDKSLARDHEGSGIGLSLVKSLVELHGGTISAISKEGVGTEFIIYLPCKLIQDQANNENPGCDRKGDSCIERINLEFSDIYN